MAFAVYDDRRTVSISNRAGMHGRGPPMEEHPSVTLFTDGACIGSPGPGGWAYILRHPASGKTAEASGGEAESTNNRMELQAVIAGLEALKRRSRVEIVTDSQYVA